MTLLLILGGILLCVLAVMLAVGVVVGMWMFIRLLILKMFEFELPPHKEEKPVRRGY